jgi:hypothetical protein
MVVAFRFIYSSVHFTSVTNTTSLFGNDRRLFFKLTLIHHASTFFLISSLCHDYFLSLRCFYNGPLSFLSCTITFLYVILLYFSVSMYVMRTFYCFYYKQQTHN